MRDHEISAIAHILHYLLLGEGPNASPHPVPDPPHSSPQAQNCLRGVVVQVVDGQELLVTKLGVILQRILIRIMKMMTLSPLIWG